MLPMLLEDSLASGTFCLCMSSSRRSFARSSRWVAQLPTTMPLSVDMTLSTSPPAFAMASCTSLSTARSAAPAPSRAMVSSSALCTCAAHSEGEMSSTVLHEAMASASSPQSRCARERFQWAMQCWGCWATACMSATLAARALPLCRRHTPRSHQASGKKGCTVTATRRWCSASCSCLSTISALPSSLRALGYSGHRHTASLYLGMALAILFLASSATPRLTSTLHRRGTRGGEAAPASSSASKASSELGCLSAAL
mmetsp:Transcript_38707/g.72604  ORF Transcript_38707/g.72604 Transcript_38707/m.72604 type:complete len:256 (-) Transcript_38707:1278-2045(-)